MTACNTPTNDAYLQPLDREVEDLMRDASTDPVAADQYEAWQRFDYDQHTRALIDEARATVFSLLASLAERGVDPAIIRRVALDAETAAERIASTIRTIREGLF